jgi:type IV secretion system protein VirB6
MDLVSEMLGMLDAAIADAGRTFFESTAASVRPLYTAFLAILLAMVGINAALNVYRISMRDAFQLSIRIVLVLMFGLSWANFSTLYNALSNGTGNLALSYFGVTGDALGAGNTYIAMDGFSQKMAENVDAVSEAQGSIMRGVISALLYAVLALLMAAYVLIVAFAKIMIAFLLGLAPFAIMATIFEKSKNLFEAWLSALIGYLLYPIAAAAIIGTVITVANKVHKDTEEVTNIGAILAFLVMCFVGFFALRAIPQAAANITGQINLANLTPEALRVAYKPLVKSSDAAGAWISPRAREFTSGFMTGKTSVLADRDRDRGYADYGRATRAKITALYAARGASPSTEVK